MIGLSKVNKLGILALSVSTLLALAYFKVLGDAKSHGPKAELASIRAYCDELDLYTLNLNRPTFLQDSVSKPWRERKTQTDEKKTPYSEATVWFRRGVPVVALISRDLHNTQWIHFMKLYFRANGTLVKSQSSAIGQQTSAIQSKYFDNEGKLLFTQTKAIDKQTLKEKPIKKLPFKIPQYQYRKITDLPFSHLLKGSAKY